MNTELRERIRGANPYPVSASVSLHEFDALRAVVPHENFTTATVDPVDERLPLPDTRRSRIRQSRISRFTIPIALATALSTGVLVAVRQIPRQPTQTTTIAATTRPFLLWPSYIPKGYCFSGASRNQSQQSPMGGALLFALRRGSSTISAYAIPVTSDDALGPHPDIVAGTSLRIGETAAVLSHYFSSTVSWRDKQFDVSVVGKGVSDETAIQAARSVKIRKNQIRMTLPGFEQFDPTSPKPGDGSVMLIPCKPTLVGTIFQILSITTTLLAPEIEASARPIKIRVRREKAKAVRAVEYEEYGNQAVTWIEDGQHIAVSSNWGPSVAELQSLIVGLKRVDTKEWDAQAAQTSPVNMAMSDKNMQWSTAITRRIGTQFQTAVIGAAVCTRWSYGASTNGMSGTSCFRPVRVPTIRVTDVGIDRVSVGTVADKSVTTAFALMPNGSRRALLSNLVPGSPTSRAFVFERPATDPIPVSITFYNVRGKVMAVWN
jgi:hypothetical protein